MCDDSQNVAINVVPSSLLSCLPPLSSDVTETKPPETSEPIDDHIEPNNCLADFHSHQGDLNVYDNQDEISVAGVTSPQTEHLCVSIDSNCFKCDICAEAKCSHLPESKTQVERLHGHVTNACNLDVDLDECKEQKHEDATSIETTNLNHDCSDKLNHLSRDKDQTVQSECSTSTDGTLRNSEESCESDEHNVHTERQKRKSKSKSDEISMGNKQSGGKQGRNEGDHEGRTKCCEIPKRKAKDRNNRSNRTSRHDDLAFDSAEVYPFDGRAISEHELHEPVELEPFEIVETDDIKFVPGAGTSDVIKSVSEPKFSTIPEEPSQGAELPSTSNENQDMSMKVPFYIEKGNRLIEPGTATAHSTFEFKQVKPKTKLIKMTPDPFDHNYENVQLASDADAGISGNNERKVSNSSSKSSSTSSSKDISRKNSKDAKQKPARKGKTKASDKPDNTTSTSVTSELTNISAGDIKRKQPKSKKEPAIRDSEIDRKIDSVLMLTQTMFSQTKPEKTEQQDNSKGSTQNVPAIKYENVGVVAKMESTGIKIVHEEVPLKSSKEGCENKTGSKSKCADDNNCEIVNATRAIAESSKKKNYPQLSSDILEISESGTLIIKSLADLPSEKPEMDSEEQSISIANEKDIDNEDVDQTDKKTSCETIDTFTEQKSMKAPYENLDECQNDGDDNETLDRPNEKVTKEMSKPIVDFEEVPPPSPSAMDALAEVEEEEEEEDDDDVFNENKRQSIEIVEFTENVCKRLSQLLILEGHREEESEDNENDIDVDSDEKKYADHIYETIDGKSKVNSGNMELHSELYEETDNMINDDSLKLSTRRESTGTLKRTSGDSETYQRQEITESISSESSDDMPSYFDPSHHSLSQTDAEVSCSVSDSYAHNPNQVDYVSGDNISKNTTFEGGRYDNVILDDEGNLLSECVKTFDLDLINDAPSTNKTEDLLDRTPTSEAHPNLTPLTELANVEIDTPLQYETSGRQSVTCTESDLDISEHRDDLSTDSMLADDEAEETMEILFTKTYTEPVEGAEVFLSCTVVNSAYKDEQKKSETWLSDEALEYFEANASEVMSTAFLKAKKEMKDIQICLQSLRQQMEHFHSDHDDISLPDLPVDSLSPDYFGIPHRKAITD